MCYHFLTLLHLGNDISPRHIQFYQLALDPHINFYMGILSKNIYLGCLVIQNHFAVNCKVIKYLTWRQVPFIKKYFLFQGN